MIRFGIVLFSQGLQYQGTESLLLRTMSKLYSHITLLLKYGFVGKM